MKRYLVIKTEFDTRANILNKPIGENWMPEIKEHWNKMKNKIIEELKLQFGLNNFDEKAKNFKDIGYKPMSFMSFHNKFFEQARNSFIIGAYYAALTATCALGERILNHLILTLRDDYKSTPEYRNVYRKNSFDNWDVVIGTLESWNVLLAPTVEAFNNLKNIRNRSIHFNPEIDENDRELALEAIRCLVDIIELQFGTIGDQPWYIPEIPGGFRYIKKEFENEPFVKKILIPNCEYVGHLCIVKHDGSQFVIDDNHEYDDRELTDEEFKTLLFNKE